MNKLPVWQTRRSSRGNARHHSFRKWTNLQVIGPGVIDIAPSRYNSPVPETATSIPVRNSLFNVNTGRFPPPSSKEVQNTSVVPSASNQACGWTFTQPGLLPTTLQHQALE